jgi:hypothetical protein
MNIIDEYYSNLNVYYSLVLYSDETGNLEDIYAALKDDDYPVAHLTSLADMENAEMNNRMFMMHHSLIRELMFMKHNDVSQFSILFCLDDDAFSNVTQVLTDLQPKTIENVIITKILF